VKVEPGNVLDPVIFEVQEKQAGVFEFGKLLELADAVVC